VNSEQVSVKSFGLRGGVPAAADSEEVAVNSEQVNGDAALAALAAEERLMAYA
jgi:hypothetical protein